MPVQLSPVTGTAAGVPFYAVPTTGTGRTDRCPWWWPGT